MNRTVTTASFARWAFESSTVDSTSNSTEYGSNNSSRNTRSAVKTREMNNTRRIISKQPTIDELTHSKYSKSYSCSVGRVLQTRQSKGSSRYTARSKKQNATATDLAAAPERTIFSLYESGKNADTRVGICIISFATAEMHVCEFIDTQVFIKTLNMLHVSQPTDILIPSHSLSGKVTKLATLIKYNVSRSSKVTEGVSKVYKAQDGLDVVENLALTMMNKSSVSFKEQLSGKEFALMAVSGAANYMAHISRLDPALDFKNFRVKVDNGENTMLIDLKTIKSLELVENSLEPNGMSLLKALDFTVTKMGRRALRSNILQPLTDASSLNQRVAAIKELQTDMDLLNSVRSELKVLHDLDGLFSKLLSIDRMIISPEQKVNYVILIKESIETMASLNIVLENTDYESDILNEIFNVLKSRDIITISATINQFINEDTRWASTNIDLQNQKVYAVKSESNNLLDVLRQLYKSLTDDIMSEIQRLRDTFGLNFSHGYDYNRQFFLKIKRKDLENGHELDCCFINRIEKKSVVEFTTLNLMKLNNRLAELNSEILTLSEQVVTELLIKLSSYMSVFFMLSEAVTALDLLCSFAKLGLEKAWCLPSFGSKLSLKSARHPILESVLPDFIPNDMEAVPNLSSFQILTGCNMSGKSLYLKQVALLNIIAQIGCPVPCNEACFPIYHKLHARLCNDITEVNSSSFSTEMKEIAYYIDDVTDKTLMIIDELGRGSSINDGFSISLAISEYLLSKKATVFLSTHFRDIAKILSAKPCVLHLEMKAEVDDSDLKMTYKASRNMQEIDGYGMKLCKKLFADDIILEAAKISELLKASRKKGLKIVETEDQEDLEDNYSQLKHVHYLVEHLKEIQSRKTPVDAQELIDLQNEFISTFEIV